MDVNESMEQLYSRLINKTEDYIELHKNEPISLTQLANNANFSDYHFHRIFKKYSDETLNGKFE